MTTTYEMDRKNTVYQKIYAQIQDRKSSTQYGIIRADSVDPQWLMWMTKELRILCDQDHFHVPMVNITKKVVEVNDIDKTFQYGIYLHPYIRTSIGTEIDAFWFLRKMNEKFK